MDGGILLQEESKEEWEQRMREAEEQRKLNRCVLHAYKKENAACIREREHRPYVCALKYCQYESALI